MVLGSRKYSAVSVQLNAVTQQQNVNKPEIVLIPVLLLKAK